MRGHTSHPVDLRMQKMSYIALRLELCSSRDGTSWVSVLQFLALPKTCFSSTMPALKRTPLEGTLRCVIL